MLFNVFLFLIHVHLWYNVNRYLCDKNLQTHKDLTGLEWAKECMVDVAQYINEVKRDSDTLQIMNDVQVPFIYLALYYFLWENNIVLL